MDNFSYLFDMSQMKCITQNYKKSPHVKNVKSEYGDKIHGEFINNFYNKCFYEFMPLSGISEEWLSEMFGEEGWLYGNFRAHGDDAYFYTKSGRKIPLELKAFGVYKSEKKTKYCRGDQYWKYKQSWKFADNPETYSTDTLLCFIDAENELLIEAIFVPKEDMKKILQERINFQYDPTARKYIQVGYNHVKHLPHLYGNKLLKKIDINQ